MRDAIRLDVVRADHLRVVEKRLVADDSGGDPKSLHRGIGRAVRDVGRDEDEGQDVVGDDLREGRGRVGEEVLDERVGEALEGLQRRGRGRSCVGAQPNDGPAELRPPLTSLFGASRVKGPGPSRSSLTRSAKNSAAESVDRAGVDWTHSTRFALPEKGFMPEPAHFFMSLQGATPASPWMPRHRSNPARIWFGTSTVSTRCRTPFSAYLGHAAEVVRLECGSQQ